MKRIWSNQSGNLELAGLHPHVERGQRPVGLLEQVEREMPELGTGPLRRGRIQPVATGGDEPGGLEDLRDVPLVPAVVRRLVDGGGRDAQDDVCEVRHASDLSRVGGVFGDEAGDAAQLKAPPAVRADEVVLVVAERR